MKPLVPTLAVLAFGGAGVALVVLGQPLGVYIAFAGPGAASVICAAAISRAQAQRDAAFAMLMMCAMPTKNMGHTAASAPAKKSPKAKRGKASKTKAAKKPIISAPTKSKRAAPPPKPSNVVQMRITPTDIDEIIMEALKDLPQDWLFFERDI